MSVKVRADFDVYLVTCQYRLTKRRTDFFFSFKKEVQYYFYNREQPLPADIDNTLSGKSVISA